MSDQYDFHIPTDDVSEDSLEQIVREFSAQEFSVPDYPQPEQQESFTAFPVKKRSPAFKTVAIICGVLLLAAAIVVGVFLLKWHWENPVSLPRLESAEAFSSLFSNPDWAQLYTMAGMEDTLFENSNTFVRYMTATTDGKRLNYLLLPQGDPLICKYAVFYDNKTIGYFTMVGADVENPAWTLDSVEFTLPHSHSVNIFMAPEYTVYVNGVALDDSYIIRSTSTSAEDFLPEGVHGYRMNELQVSDLLMEPHVNVTDAAGNPVSMVYDSDTRTYTLKEEKAPEITEDHKQFALDAAKTCAAFAIRAKEAADLEQFFDPNSNAFQAASAAAPLLEGCADYTFDPSMTEVTNYYSYGNSLFSVSVTLKLDATMENGDLHSFDLSWNYLYTQDVENNFRIIEMSDQSFQTLREQVRLTYINEGRVEKTKMVDIHENVLILPRISAPEGKLATGWAQKRTNSMGDEVMAIIFPITDNDVVLLPQDSTLEPMTLYAVYEDIS